MPVGLKLWITQSARLQHLPLVWQKTRKMCFQKPIHDLFAAT